MLCLLCRSWPRICLGVLFRGATGVRLGLCLLLLALLLAAGCVQPTPPEDAAALKAEAIALAKEDPIVYKLERFASAFNDPTLRKVLSAEQDKILYELRYEAVLWGENRYRVNLFDSLGGKDNKAELWVLVDLKAKRVVEYSVDFSSDSRFMDAVSKFLFAPANAKMKSILDSVSKFVPISSCEQWGGERDMCYGYLAVVKDNPYICDEIMGFDGKFTCVAAVTKNPPRCEAVNFANIPSCRILAITLTQDCLAYDPVKHEGETASLQDRCLVLLPEKATAFGPSLCEMISDPAYKLRCQDSVAFNHQDNELCDKMDNASRKVCRALALRDPKYCKKSNSEESDEGCVVLLAKKAKNAEFCGVLPNPDACYKEVAIAKQDKALCEKIDLGNADARKGCYTFTSDWKPSKLIKGYIPYTALIPTGVGR